MPPGGKGHHLAERPAAAAVGAGAEGDRAPDVNHNPTLNVGFAERPYKGHYSSST